MNYTIILISVLAGAFVILLGWVVFLQLAVRDIKDKNKRLFAEVKSGDVVQLLNATLKELDELNKKFESIRRDLEKTDATAKESLHKIGIVRYNPFGDTGGDQSFSVSLLNDSHSGFVMTSIHGRDGDRIYAKPVVEGTSPYNLAEEEKEVLKIAIKQKAKDKNGKER